MVSEENRTGLYIALPCYFSVLVTAAFLAYKKTEVQKSDGVNDQLSAHYLGGRGFGPLVTAGTLFASLFSGYTVVGVPNESYKDRMEGTPMDAQSHGHCPWILRNWTSPPQDRPYP